jgi:hypothetical protein
MELFLRVIAALRKLDHAYLGLQRSDGSHHLCVLMDSGAVVYAEKDDVTTAAPDELEWLDVICAEVASCIATRTPLYVTARDDDRDATYVVAYIDGKPDIPRPNPEAVPGWADINYLLG